MSAEGDRPCLVGRACRAEICRDGCKWPDPDAVSGGGAEASREAGDSTPRDPHGSMLCCGGTDYHDAGCPVPALQARIVELTAEKGTHT
jgi:hypothetical protein